MKKLLTLALALLSFLTGVSKAAQPNIVIVLAADMGYGDAGCYNENSKCSTPHIDALAKSGKRFTDAHSTGAWRCRIKFAAC